MEEQYYRKMLNKTECKNPKNMSYSDLQHFSQENDLETLYNDLYNQLTIEKTNFEVKISEFVNNKDAMYILSKLYAFSENSYLVGGSVRDILLGYEPKDFDFVTDIPYEKLRYIFSSSDFSFKETGKQFLVFNLNYNGVDYEIANFRKDGTYTDGRRPDSVEIGTIIDDYHRRDFTINGIFWNRIKGIVCSKQSFEDIKNRTLRFIGSPEDRINEDGLRILRFYRILKNKELTPDKKTLKAVRSHFEKLLNVSPHRIMMEIERICL